MASEGVEVVTVETYEQDMQVVEGHLHDILDLIAKVMERVKDLEKEVRKC